MLGSRWCRSTSVAGREIRKPIFDRIELENASRNKSATNRAVPSAVLSAILPEKPSHTITSTAPRDNLSPSMNPAKVIGRWSAARFVADLLREAFSSSMRSKIGFLISRPATEVLRHHLDPNNHNGAVFLGLNGLVVKRHGGANETGVATAIAVAAKSVRDDLARRIADDLQHFARREPAGEAA